MSDPTPRTLGKEEEALLDDLRETCRMFYGNELNTRQFFAESRRLLTAFLTQREAARAGPDGTLRRFVGNVAALRAFEHEVRAVIGNTNWACIFDDLAAVDALASRPVPMRDEVREALEFYGEELRDLSASPWRIGVALLTDRGARARSALSLLSARGTEGEQKERDVRGELGRVRIALKRYGRHLPWCLKIGTGSSPVPEPCSCGFDRASEPVPAPVREGPKPTHRCKVCGALWRLWDCSWSLVSAKAGECCDNAEMGLQIEALPPAPGPDAGEMVRSLLERVRPFVTGYALGSEKNLKWFDADSRAALALIEGRK
jgi:hypothetical protein